jgi:hypothetical protein
MIAILDDERWVQVVQANYEIPTTIHARRLLDKHTEATPSYEVVSMNDIVLSTVNLDEPCQNLPTSRSPRPLSKRLLSVMIRLTCYRLLVSVRGRAYCENKGG